VGGNNQGWGYGTRKSFNQSGTTNVSATRGVEMKTNREEEMIGRRLI